MFGEFLVARGGIEPPTQGCFILEALSGRSEHNLNLGNILWIADLL